MAMLTSVHELPAGMWFYLFMFGEKKPLVSQYIAEGRLSPPSSLLLGMGAGVALTVARLMLDWVVFKPLARKILGFSGSTERTEDTPVPMLDAMCSKSKALTSIQVATATASTGMSPEQVQDYARAKRESSLQDKQIGKFKEAAWRLVVYSGLVGLALQLCFGEPWFNDPFLVWKNWPAGDHGPGLEMYYHISMGVYWHFIAFQFWDTRRSDFWQMLIHHVATLFLLTYSWLLSLVRIGTLVMLVHDVSDVFLESAKLFNYAQKRFPWCNLLADGIFFLFATVFGYTRLYLYPKYMVYNTWQAEELDIVSRSFFCVMFFTLLVLHVFWMYLILRMVHMFVFHGVEEDIRSENGAADTREPSDAVAPSNATTSANGHANGKAPDTSSSNSSSSSSSGGGKRKTS